MRHGVRVTRAGFSLPAMCATLDAPVLAAPWCASDDAALDDVAQPAGVSMDDLRASMHRLALRQPGVNWPVEFYKVPWMAPRWAVS